MSRHDFQADLDAVARIDAVPLILDVLCRSTGMGFAAVARVTDSRWIVCKAKDEIAFGLAPGGELEISTTICKEVRGRHKIIVPLTSIKSLRLLDNLLKNSAVTL